jgi:signal transduction histidine kinase
MLADASAGTQFDLAQAIDQVLADERRLATRAASFVRLGNSLLILAIIFTSWRASGDEAWARLMIPVAVYVIGALGIFLLRSAAAAGRLVFLTGFIDIAAVSAILFGVESATTRSPLAVAAFGLGVFAFVVASSALVVRGGLVFVIAGVAAISETWLLRSVPPMPSHPVAGADAPVDWGVIAIAGVLLFAVAAMTQLRGSRLRTLAEDLARTEVERRLAQMRGEVLVREKQHIETRLVDSLTENDVLKQLQAAKESLAQVLVHDLRSPLSAVMATLDLVRQELEDAHLRPDLQRSASGAYKQAERLTAMISDLLDVAKLEEGHLKPRRETLSAADICEGVRSQICQLPRARKLEIRADSEPGLRVDADPNLLLRMVENLAVNAVRFANRTVRISAARDGGSLVFRVQNDGPPISPAMRAHLFEKFAQAGRTDGGWGLGLYFCKLAAEVHGGSVGFDEDPAWNVTFVVRLPAHVHGTSLAA